jgi:hypothetical protein
MARRSTTGRLYITRLRPAQDPVTATYLLTFGSPGSRDIALSLGSVRGLDGLTEVLRAGRVPTGEIEKAWRVLAVETSHQVPNVALTRAMMRRLDL